MNIVNLTPHTITLRVNGVDTSFHASGTIARVSQDTEPNGIIIADAQVFTSTFGSVTGIPDGQDNTVFIVSGMVLSALAGCRKDVIAPKTDNTAIRNEANQIIAVTGWLM